ncbi:MAG: MFS transporter [Kutzneria sp.]|nr:MFS transporter [Kutzneria sp.]
MTNGSTTGGVRACPAGTGLRRSPDPHQLAFGARFVAAVSAGSVLNPINSSIIAVAMVSIGQAFGVGADTTTWLVSALYLATAVGQPTMGRLADLFGPRRVYLAGLGLVATGGLLGFCAPSLGVLVGARVVIGLGTSAAYPAAIALLRLRSERVGRPPPGGVLGALAVAGQASMAIGPPLGGLLLAIGGWRSVFVVNLPLAVLGAALALRWLPADKQVGHWRWRQMWHTLDPLGLGLFVLAMTSLLVFLVDVTELRWSLLAAAAVATLALIVRELRAATPFLNVRMLAGNRPLVATYVRYMVTFLITYCVVYGWTQWLEQSAGYSASGAGLLLMPSFVVAAVASALIARRNHVRAPLVTGAGVLLAVSVSLLSLTASSSLWSLLCVSAAFGLQNGLLVVANQAAMYTKAPADQIGVAAGLLRTFMYLGAMLSASLIGVAFGSGASDAGLHRLAVVLTVASALLLVSTLVSGNLPRSGDRSAHHPQAHKH